MRQLDRRQDLLFYDGGCGLCHRAVRFVMRRDRDGARFRFAPLGGESFEALVPEAHRAEIPDSLVVRTGEGRLLYRSGGVVHILQRLGGAWPTVGRLISRLPLGLRDATYDWLARHRSRFFRSPRDSCPVVSAAERARFDP